jgi:hypothetical protein
MIYDMNWDRRRDEIFASSGDYEIFIVVLLYFLHLLTPSLFPFLNLLHNPFFNLDQDKYQGRE